MISHGEKRQSGARAAPSRSTPAVTYTSAYAVPEPSPA